MKGPLVLMMLLLAVSMALTSVSAIVCEQDCDELTTVGGTIYHETIDNPVEGADVEVTCDGETKTTTSDVNGSYSVVFEDDECELGDTVTVHAEKDALTGDNVGSIDMTYHYDLGCFCCLDLNVGIVNVPLIPEFGLVIGTLTAISAIGIFFFVRRN